MIKTGKFFIPIVVLIGAIVLFNLPADAGDTAVTNETGFTLGQLLLGWRIMTSGFIEPGNIIEDTNLGEIITKLKDYAGLMGSPESIQRRIERLGEKYQLAQTKFLWKYQSGYWGCNSDTNIKLSGPEIQSDLSEQKGQEFLYLQFNNPNDYALVNLSDKYLSPPLDTYSLEFWIRPMEVVTGLLLQTADWRLTLSANRLTVHSTVVEDISLDQQLIAEYWNHLAIISNGEVLFIYLDGALVAETDVNKPVPLGNELKFGGGFVGGIDEIRVKPRQVQPLEIHFDQPIDYSIGYPFVSWAGETLSGSELWRFYASLLVSGLRIKQESKLSSIDPQQLSRISEFLLGEVEGVPPPPASLSQAITRNLEAISAMASQKQLSSKERETISTTLTDLMGYLDLT